MEIQFCRKRENSRVVGIVEMRKAELIIKFSGCRKLLSKGGKLISIL